MLLDRTHLQQSFDQDATHHSKFVVTWLNHALERVERKLNSIYGQVRNEVATIRCHDDNWEDPKEADNEAHWLSAWDPCWTWTKTLRSITKSNTIKFIVNITRSYLAAKKLRWLTGAHWESVQALYWSSYVTSCPCKASKEMWARRRTKRRELRLRSRATLPTETATMFSRKDVKIGRFFGQFNKLPTFK